jgi:hypothetical protein
MRENRQSGSEGGEPQTNAAFLPLSRRVNPYATVPRAALRSTLGYLILPRWGTERSMVDQASPRVFCHHRTGQDNPSDAI